MITTRRVLTVLLFLLAGAVVNVAVAWGCATLAPIVKTDGTTNTVSTENEGWAVRRWRNPGVEFVQSKRSTLLAPSPGRHGGLPSQGPSPSLLMPTYAELKPHADYIKGGRKSDDRAALATGWPMLTLWCEYEMYAIALVEVNGGIITPIAEPDYREYFPGFRREWPRALPLRPLWFGFAGNTLLYAAVLWLVFFAPFQLRRSIRRRRNLCPACGYPRGTSPVCTECGVPISRNANT